MRFWYFLPFAAFALCAQQMDLPLALVASPDGQFVLALDSGKTPGISVRAAANPGKELSRLSLPDAWLGLVFAPDKKTLYAGGGSRGSVFEISFSPGELKIVREMKASDFVGDVALSPDGHLIYAADVFANVIAVINPQSGRVIDRFKTGRRPYRIVFHPDGKSFFVSSWADASVNQYNADTGEEIGRIRLAPHPTDMAISSYQPPVEEGDPKPDWKYRLFVAASNTNSVYSVGIGENKTMRIIESIDLAPEVSSSVGMTPSALALSPDQKTLFVVCSDAGTVANVDVSEERGVLAGYSPPASEKRSESPASYPLAVHAMNDGSATIAFRAGNEIEDVPEEKFGPFVQPRNSNRPASGAPNPAEHVVYIIHPTSPEETMRAIAGIAPDFTVKLSRQAKFNLADPANNPPAGYLWTNALAAGMTVQSYGVFMKDGKPIDPAMRDFSDPDVKNFFADLKEGEASGDMPKLIVMQVADEATRQMVADAVKKSRFAPSTEIVIDDLSRVEGLLGLKPMTRRDAVGR